jgi:hypothetical protein
VLLVLGTALPFVCPKGGGAVEWWRRGQTGLQRRARGAGDQQQQQSWRNRKAFQIGAPYLPTKNSPKVIRIPPVLRAFIPKYYCDLLKTLSPR